MHIFGIFRLGYRLIETFGAMPFIILGVLGFAVSATMFSLSASDKHVFDASQSCKAGFALRTTLDGACHVELDEVASVYESRRPLATIHADLRNAGGERFDVRLVHGRNDDLFEHLKPVEGRSTRVQYLGSTPIAIETTSGMDVFSSYPDLDRIKTWLYAAIAMAVVGIVAALAWRPAPLYGMNGLPVREHRR